MKSGINQELINKQIRPQDDLYRFANGAWLSTAQIPDDRASAGITYELFLQAEAQVKAIIESDGGKIGELYRSFMDTQKIESDGINPILEDLAKVEKITDAKSLIATISQLEITGGPSIFGSYIYPDVGHSTQYAIYIYQGGLSLPDEAYYREDQYQPIRDAFLEHIEKMSKISGVAIDAQTLLAHETKIASIHWDQVKDRDAIATYNKRSFAELQTLSPNIDWQGYLEAGQIPATKFQEIVVREPDFFEGLSKLLGEFDLRAWQNWLRWQILSGSASYLNEALVNQNFAFYGTTLSGTPQIRERYKRAISLVEGAMGEEIGKEYVKRHFPESSKQKMEALVGNLLKAYEVSIKELDWMSAQTKVKALDKLAKFRPKIAYPDKWRDYSRLEIGSDLHTNLANIAKFEREYQLNKLGGPIDRDEWAMTPQTVNAYYNPGYNEIVFPAAILQPPFFNPDADDAANYGGIGAVIGHEIGHGFDDQGSRYDGDGNLNNWWSDEDRAEFEKRTGTLVDQYDQLSPSAALDVKVNGEFTLGENIGDLGGMNIAIKAYRISLAGEAAPEIDGLSAMQRFFLSWAQCWRRLIRPEEARLRIATDPHSPDEHRCNQIVRNLDEFYAAFEVKESDALYLKERVRIW
ncbi:MAG: M13 family metallopeptidase [Candidatus Nanopelagicaceae bacterium]